MGNSSSRKTSSDSAQAQPACNGPVERPTRSPRRSESPPPTRRPVSRVSPNPSQNPTPPSSSQPEYNSNGSRILSKQPLSGRQVILQRDEIVLKYGGSLVASEPEAMVLVETHAPNVPIPEYIVHRYYDDESPRVPHLWMSYIPGQTLESAWSTLPPATKDRICADTWALIQQIRRIPRPESLTGLWACAADGSPSLDPLLKDLAPTPVPLKTDAQLRARIYERYIHFNGRRHEHDLAGLLPRSTLSVFTHGDIAPRNLLIDDQHQIVGVLDWEEAGWYPHYWEFARIMRPQGGGEDGATGRRDWQARMERVAPREVKCSMEGFVAARRLLF